MRRITILIITSFLISFSFTTNKLLWASSFASNFAKATSDKKATEDKSEPILESKVLLVTKEGEDVSEEKLLSLLEDVHEKIEADDSNEKGLIGFLKTWAKSFDFRRMGINAYRIYLENKHNPHLKDHTLNIVLMLSLSHMTEMLSGPLSVTIGSKANFPPLILWILGAGGTIISIPGFDPLCIGLLVSYKYKPVQKTISSIRIVLVRSTHFLAKMFGLPILFRWLFQFEDPIRFLLQTLDKAPGKRFAFIDQDLESRDRFEFSFKNAKNETYLTLGFKKDPSDQIYLADMKLNRNSYDPQEKITLVEELRAFGWNIKDGILGVLAHCNNIESLQSKAYIKKINSRAPHELIVIFKPFTLPWPKVRFIRNNRERPRSKFTPLCQGIFEGHVKLH